MTSRSMQDAAAVLRPAPDEFSCGHLPCADPMMGMAHLVTQLYGHTQLASQTHARLVRTRQTLRPDRRLLRHPWLEREKQTGASVCYRAKTDATGRSH